MFEPTKDFSAFEEDGTITLLIKDVEDTQCAFLWKPVDPYTGKWMRMRYNGSSPFAMWWSQMFDDGYDDCEVCGQPFENEPDCPKVCGDCEKNPDSK